MITFLWLLTSVIGQGQVRVDNNLDSLLNAQDSVLARLNSRIDSLQLHVNKILNPDLSAVAIYQRLRDRLTDSLQAGRQLDSIKGTLRHKIDSLTHLNLPVDKYKHKLDSISQFNPQSYLENVSGKVAGWESKVNKRIDDLESKINEPVNDLEANVNEKLAVLSQEGGAAANLPGPDLNQDANLNHINPPGVDLKLPDLDLNADLNLDMPGLEDVKNTLKDVENPLAGEMEQLVALKQEVDGVKDIPQQQLDRLKSIDEVEAIQSKADQANAIIDKAQDYSQDVTRVANGDFAQVEEIPKAIENRIANMEEMKEVQEVTQYQGMDPEALRAMAKEAAVRYATDHFAGKQQALQGAMEKMNKLKSKYPEVPNLKVLARRVPNSMKGKPFIERVIPGFVFQIQKANTFMIDLNPSVAWRFTGRFTAGAGWNERLSFSEWNKIEPTDRIYGPRGFTSFSLKQGFSLKAEVEKMNVFIPYFYGTTDGSRGWVWSVFAGFKKDYTFHKNVKGNVQVLYNLYDDHDNSPYVDRLNVRMGFELGMKKRN